MPDPTAPAQNAPQTATQAFTPTVTKSEFIMLATLAWMTNPSISLAQQMSEATGVGLRNCQYWLSISSERTPTAHAIAAAHKAATERFPAYADLLDRLDGVKDA